MSEEDTENPADESDKDWIERESTKTMLMRGLLIACAVSVLLEVFVLGRDKHKPVDWGFGFYGVLSFVVCTAMVFLAKGLGSGLKAPTDFYDERSETDGEEGSK